MLKLQLKERILLHLTDYVGARPTPFKREFPLILSQSGIADTLGSSLERVSTNLRDLEKGGLIKRRKEYSRKTGRFRNFYFPTRDGVSKCEEIKKMLDEELIKVRDLNDELKEMKIHEIISYLTRISKSTAAREIYKLKEAPQLEINYTNILNNISRNMFDVRTILEPKILDINKRMWTIVRDAYYDVNNKYVVLTKNQNWQAGVLWLKRGIRSPFTAEFRFKAGGGTGGDGLVFMFYKKRGYWPCDGGNLGFVPGTTPILGYGIEFDSLPNPDYNDPPYPHIALVKDHANNHLKHVEDGRVNDFKWHNVKLLVEESLITVYVDNGKILEWNGIVDRAHDGIGFAASTGGLDSWHIIDDVKITKIAASRTKQQ